MKYTKEFKLECVRKYKNGEYIKDPSGVKHCHFHNQVLIWSGIYDIFGEVGFEYNKPKVPAETIVELIKRVEAGESYSQVALSVGRQPDALIRWHKIYLQDGIDGLKSLKRGKKPMTVKKPKENKKKNSLTQDERIKELEETNEYLRAENEYLKKLNALVQKRKAQEPKKK